MPLLGKKCTFYFLGIRNVNFRGLGGYATARTSQFQGQKTYKTNPPSPTKKKEVYELTPLLN